MNNDCIFCKVARRESPATIEAETQRAIAFRSIEPVATHHILVVPKNHIAHFGDIAKEDKETIFEMVELVQKLVSDLDIGKGYKVMVNGGAYQVVPHLHWHVLSGLAEDKDAITRT